MKLAISNIAWTPDDDHAIGEVMRREGADAVEIAPTLYWKEPLAATPSEIDAVRHAWERRGFPVVALQSLVFGLPHLQLFPLDGSKELALRLEGIVQLASRLGARVLVFGSPKNRLRGEIPHDEALASAVPFFRRVGEYAARHGVTLCIEPNPPQYGCDFVVNAREGRDLVARVGSPGFGLHLDLAGMHLAGDDPAVEIERSLPFLRHVHASAPQLAPVPSSDIDYRSALDALRAGKYQGFVSVEMRAADDPRTRTANVARALRHLRGLTSP